MADAKFAVEILSSGDDVRMSKVMLCGVCVQHGTTCPHKGKEVSGLCGSYSFNMNVKKVEEVILLILQQRG